MLLTKSSFIKAALLAVLAFCVVGRNALQAADIIDAKDYGAIGDANSHPISGLTTFNGVNVTGWTLSQWQTAYPFVTALTNETDEVGILAAENAALSSKLALRIPAGKYLENFTGVINPAAGQPVVITGDGDGTRLVVEGAVTPFNYTMPATTSAASARMSFRNFTAYQNQDAVAGTLVSITGATSGGGNPVVIFENDQFGQANLPINTTGTFTTAVILKNVASSSFIDDQCLGSVNYGLSGPNGRNGTCVSNNGTSSSSLSFGPNFTGTYFQAMNIAVLIGNGTDAYVQGVKFNGGSLVGCNQLVKWHASSASEADDYLSVIGMDLQSYGLAIDVDTVTTLVVANNYFLGGSSGSEFLNVAETGNQVQQFVIGHNMLSAFGVSPLGIKIAGSTAAQVGVSISDNSFFDFDNSGEVPLNLPSSAENFNLSGNVFADSNLPIDAGDNNNWTNTTKVTTGSAASFYATGIPVADPTQPGISVTSPYVSINRAPVADQAKNVLAITTGGSQTVANTTSWQVYTSSGPIATFTTKLPASPVDGQEVTFAAAAQITAWTVLPNTGQSISTAPTTLTSASMVTFRWNKTFSAWQPRSVQNTQLLAPLASPTFTGTVTVPQLVTTGPASEQAYYYVPITTGGQTVTLPSGDAGFLLNPDGSSTATLVMPAAPADGALIYVDCLGPMTELTINYNAHTSFAPTSSSCTASQSHLYKYFGVGLNLWIQKY